MDSTSSEGRLARLLPTLLLLAPTAALRAQELDPGLLETFAWRELGPTVFGGRITDLALVHDEPATLLVAGASGGLFRSRNLGTTWECIFQDEGTISIGDVAVDPTNPDVIWVGTGEANNQRSSYWGDGVYKTEDGGQSWIHTGLADTHHIGRIAVDPTDPDVVWVAALGHLYTENAERGLYRTADGGKSWEKVLDLGETVGVVDVVLDPADPRTAWAASYERLRRPWHFDGAGPGSGIHRTRDGGESWTRLAGGLPEGELGRIGLAVFAADPPILFATVSNQNEVPVETPAPEIAFEGEAEEEGIRITEVREGSRLEEAGLKQGDLLLKLGGERVRSGWQLLVAISRIPVGEEAELVLSRDGVEMKLASRIREVPETRSRRPRQEGGESWEKRNEKPVGGSPPYYYGQIRVHPTDPERLCVLGVSVFASQDGGRTWERNLAGSVHSDHHALEYDPRVPGRLILGHDGGLAISHDGGQSWDQLDNLPLAQFYAAGVDLRRPYHVYGGTQDNGTWGGPSRSRSSRGISRAEWYRVGGGDGFHVQIDPLEPDVVYGESQFGGLFRRDLRDWVSRSIRPPRSEPEGDRDRFNWSSPILISHHNPRIVYFGGNKLFKSLDRGESWPCVSPDLTTADEEKIQGNVPHCTITTIAESPVDPNLLLVGTDDGLVQRSEDGGLEWTNLTGRFPGVPAGWWVSRVELSRHERDTAYASFTGYREDDFRPLVFFTRNGGENWESIAGDLPEGPVNVVREDPRNPDLLWLGTDLGAFVSVDRGAHWGRLGRDLPTIAVHDLVVHPRDRDLVAATHGRGLFVLDAAPLQELTAEVLEADVHLFEVKDATLWQSVWRGGGAGDRTWHAPNPPSGAAISYLLREEVEEDEISLTILNEAGEKVRELEPQRTPGLHRASWSLRGSRRGGGRARARPTFSGPGTYAAVLEVKGKEHRRTFEVRPDPILLEGR